MTALSNTFDRLPTHRGRDSGGQLLPLVLKTVCVIGGLSAAHLAGFMLRVPDPFRMLAITSLAADVTTIFWFHVVAFYVASAAVATTVYAVLLNLLHHVALPRRRRFRFGPSGAVNGPDRPEDGIPTTTRPESVGDPVAERGDGAPAKPVRPRRALDDLRERVQPVSNYRRTRALLRGLRGNAFMSAVFTPMFAVFLLLALYARAFGPTLTDGLYLYLLALLLVIAIVGLRLSLLFTKKHRHKLPSLFRRGKTTPVTRTLVSSAYGLSLGLVSLLAFAVGALRHDYLGQRVPVTVGATELQGEVRPLAASGNDLLALESREGRWTYVLVRAGRTYR